MAKKLLYEWTVEELDDDESAANCDFSDKLAMLMHPDAPCNIGLVRDVFDDQRGLIERDWAYIVKGQLPETFFDSGGTPSHSIPQRFRDELEAHQNKLGIILHSQNPHAGF